MGLEFGVWVLGFGWVFGGLGFTAQGFEVWGFGIWGWSLGVRVLVGLEFGVYDFGIKACGVQEIQARLDFCCLRGPVAP